MFEARRTGTGFVHWGYAPTCNSNGWYLPSSTLDVGLREKERSWRGQSECCWRRNLPSQGKQYHIITAGRWANPICIWNSLLAV